MSVLGKPLKNPAAPFWVAMNTFEKALILRGLEAAGGSLTRTAARFGVSRQFLAGRCAQRGVKTPFGYSDERKRAAAEARHGKKNREAAASAPGPALGEPAIPGEPTP